MFDLTSGLQDLSLETDSQHQPFPHDTEKSDAVIPAPGVSVLELISKTKDISKAWSEAGACMCTGEDDCEEDITESNQDALRESSSCSCKVLGKACGPLCSCSEVCFNRLNGTFPPDSPDKKESEMAESIRFLQEYLNSQPLCTGADCFERMVSVEIDTCVEHYEFLRNHCLLGTQQCEEEEAEYSNENNNYTPIKPFMVEKEGLYVIPSESRRGVIMGRLVEVECQKRKKPNDDNGGEGTSSKNTRKCCLAPVNQEGRPCNCDAVKTIVIRVCAKHHNIIQKHITASRSNNSGGEGDTHKCPWGRVPHKCNHEFRERHQGDHVHDAEIYEHIRNVHLHLRSQERDCQWSGCEASSIEDIYAHLEEKHLQNYNPNICYWVDLDGTVCLKPFMNASDDSSDDTKGLDGLHLLYSHIKKEHKPHSASQSKQRKGECHWLGCQVTDGKGKGKDREKKKNVYETHMIVHIPPTRRAPNTCSHCGAPYQSKNSLERHIKAKHPPNTGTRPTGQNDESFNQNAGSNSSWPFISSGTNSLHPLPLIRLHWHCPH
eukprot:Nk52_evm1s1886 gene=Nk52_evmTU1s1886